MHMDDIPKKTKSDLTRQFKELNPFKLQNNIMQKIKEFHRLKRQLDNEF